MTSGPGDIFDAYWPPDRRSRLLELERKIERENLIGSPRLTNHARYVDVGTWLGEIRDKRLFNNARFGDYCRERWGVSGSWANKLVAAAEVARLFIVCGREAPPNASAALKVDIATRDRLREQHRREVAEEDRTLAEDVAEENRVLDATMPF